jgi:hypothetical protein
MSFRERMSHQPEWDSDEDAAPPVWRDHTSSSPANGAVPPSPGDLPRWSRHARAGDGADEDPYVPLPPPRTRRSVPPSSDRRATPWPNLRDSLKGSSSAASGTRGGRRASPYASPPTSRSQAGVSSRPEGDEDDLPWPTPNDVPFEPAGAAIEAQRYPARREGTGRSRARPRRATPARSRPQFQFPAALASIAAAQDRTVLTAVGGSALSLLVMIATVGSRSDSLPSWIVIHLNAAGDPDRWGTASTVWRLPLMTAMLTLGTFAGALFVARRDPFASRFLLLSVLLIHALAWIGLVRILW